MEIYQQIAKELVKVFNRSSALFFPKYYNNDEKEYRISEQESKIIFSNILFNKQIPFAVEVPTEAKFRFTGEGDKKKSARYDMVIFKEHADEIKYVIELKAHNPEFEQIRKDIEKFASSDSNCIWLHTLEKADSNTYKKLFAKINESINGEKTKIVGEHQWDFVIVSLQENKLYIFSLKISQSLDFKDLDIKSFQEVDLA
jgi:hypothetical protein